MVDYRGLLDVVRRHVERQGVRCAVNSGKPASEKAIAATEAKLKVRLPAELREFYRTVADGYAMFWQADPNDAGQPFSGLQVPKLSSLAGLYSGWRGMALYSPEQAEAYGFPYTKDPALAKHTAARQWHWLPVIEQGNGDLICLDLSAPDGPVVFHKHDWLDGGSGDDGHPLAPGWRAFLAGWGSVCFQLPAGLYWPSCFRPGGGVAWDGEQFRGPFRMAGLAEPHAAADRGLISE
ncbi:SMI1/KNR4 family protein [bacterium]|nr:SMI1/KNR4 family protein [bacterium]